MDGRETRKRTGLQPGQRQSGRDRSRFWYDFGRYNLTGWSVVLPTLAGIALGYWLDHNHPSSFSWTITLMVVGLTLGCLNAWYWISRTNQHRDQDEKKQRDAGRREGRRKS